MICFWLCSNIIQPSTRMISAGSSCEHHIFGTLTRIFRWVTSTCSHIFCTCFPYVLKLFCTCFPHDPTCFPVGVDPWTDTVARVIPMQSIIDEHFYEATLELYEEIFSIQGLLQQKPHLHNISRWCAALQWVQWTCSELQLHCSVLHLFSCSYTALYCIYLAAVTLLCIAFT